MNARIIQLFGFIVVCFAVLIGFTSQWSVFGADDLRQQTVNKRPLFEAQQIKRGSILAADGTLIARSVSDGRGASRQFVREYPLDGLFGHPIGYSFLTEGNSEFERFHNDELTGSELRVHDDLRRVARPRQDRQQHRHQPRPDRPADGLRPARGPSRSGGRDRAFDRQDPGHGQPAPLRSEPDPGRS